MKSQLIAIVAALLVVGCGEAKPPKSPTAKAPDISIHEAARTGNIEAIKKHLADGVDVNAKDGGRYEGDLTGLSPLYYAAMFSHGEIVETLIANGADVNAKGFRGKTILDTALYTPLPGDGGKTIEILRKHGAKSSAEDSIHLAAELGNIEAVKQHLEAGVDVNAKDFRGSTPLDVYSASFNKTEITDLLRKHGGKTGGELKAEGK